MYYNTFIKSPTGCINCDRPLISWEQVDGLLQYSLSNLLFDAGLSKYDNLLELSDYLSGKIWEKIEYDYEEYATDIPIPQYFYIDWIDNCPELRPAKVLDETLEVECSSCIEERAQDLY